MQFRFWEEMVTSMTILLAGSLGKLHAYLLLNQTIRILEIDIESCRDAKLYEIGAGTQEVH